MNPTRLADLLLAGLRKERIRREQDRDHRPAARIHRQRQALVRHASRTHCLLAHGRAVRQSRNAAYIRFYGHRTLWRTATLRPI